MLYNYLRQCMFASLVLDIFADVLALDTKHTQASATPQNLERFFGVQLSSRALYKTVCEGVTSSRTFARSTLSLNFVDRQEHPVDTV